MRPVLQTMRIAVPALALAALAASCGDSDPQPPDEPPGALLREAAANPPASGRAKIAVDALLAGDSLISGPAALRLEGPYALDPVGDLPSFEFAMDAEVAGFGVDGSLVSTGDDAFVVFFGENYRVGVGRTAELERRLRGATPGGDGGLGLRFDDWIRDPEYGEVEDVGGTDAVRVSGLTDPDAAFGSLIGLADQLGVPAGPLTVSEVSSGPADAWIALEDRMLRRIRIQLEWAIPPSMRSQAGGVAGGALTLDAEVSDVGAEVTVEPPPGGGFQPIEDLTDRISGLIGLAL